MKKITTITFFLFTIISFSQVKGLVTNTKSEPLPFVSVYLENSTVGTTSNNDGKYNLSITEKGEYNIVFQFLGFKTLKKNIRIAEFPYELNIQLQEEQFSLDEVQVNSKENPANRVIRNAIAAKDKNSDKFSNYTANFYSRGLFKIKDAPKKILGQEIGDLGGGLDSTRSGIVYLSETVSKVQFQKNPKRFKEHIIASKVSGEDNGISFNRADEVNFNFYENTFLIGDTPMISPISNQAFGYYKYKLAGTFYDNDGRLINKIQLIPRRENDRVFSGFIYIIEDEWAIYGTDLKVTGAQVNIPVVERLFIKQDYKYVKEIEGWILITQTIDFKAGMFGINFNGRFSAAYSKYNFPNNFVEKTFTNEILSFEKNATKKDSLYWNTIRPVPLTLEEVSDYKVKDSIKTLKKSKKYLDSIDNKSNKFKLLSPVLGYSYRNSHKKWSINVGSPITKINFNTVQGWNSSLNINYSKRLNEEGKRLNTGASFNYGLSDKKLRPTGYFSYRWNNITKPQLFISGGITTSQFNAKNPISPFWNTISSVLFERNYMKIYEKSFAKIAYSQEVTNGLRMYSSLEFSDRKPLFNTTDYVMFPSSKVDYTSNNPQNPSNFTNSFTPNKIWTLDIGASIQFGQKYLSYPNRKINLGSRKYPSLYLGYKKNFGSETSEFNSDIVYSQLRQYIELGGWGSFKYKAKGGVFLEKKDIPFTDYAHFNGNRLLVAPQNNYLDGFLALPYYQLSTNDKYGELHGEHNFRGALLSKIPLVNKLNFHLVAGAKGLFTAGNKPYSEYTVGLDNVGFGKWRFFRVDYVRSNFNGDNENRVVFGIKL